MNVLSSPRFANVTALLALVVASAGTSYAAVALPKNSVGSAQIQSSSIKSGDVKNDGLTGKDIKESTLGQVGSAVNANSLGGQPAAGYQDKASILFATIERATPSTPPVLGKSRGVLGIEGNQFGSSAVHYNRDVSGCTWLGSPTNAGSVSISPSTVHPNDGSWVQVITYNENGVQTGIGDISVAALCS